MNTTKMSQLKPKEKSKDKNRKARKNGFTRLRSIGEQKSLNHLLDGSSEEPKKINKKREDLFFAKLHSCVGVLANRDVKTACGGSGRAIYNLLVVSITFDSISTFGFVCGKTILFIR